MAGREDGTRTTTFRTIAALTLLPILGLAIFFLWNSFNGGTTPEEQWKEIKASPPQLRTTSQPSEEQTALPRVRPLRQPEKSADAPPKRARSGSGNIVLIIDDLGFEGQPIEKVMALDPNVNCAILPNGNRASAIAKMLANGGFEVLCHLPMEPMGSASPGENAILTSMPDDEISRLTRENVDAVPYARGVNNHMGSRATSDPRVMQSVLRALPDGMYFIDSRTTGKSVAAKLARENNVRTASRHVFLDDVATEASVRKQVEALADAAAKNGLAVGIGHPHAVTMRVLAEEMPRLRAAGFRFVRASEAVR